MTIHATDVTLTGTLTDQQGNTLNGTLTITLEGFGGTVPLIAGVQALPGIQFTATVSSGTFSTNFYSNQIITPGPLVTFYNISFQVTPGAANQVYNFSENFQFGPGTFDLSNLVPLNQTISNTSLPNTVQPHTFAPINGQWLTGLSGTGNFSASPLTATGELVLSETGDTFDGLNVHIRNRTAQNGIFIENPGVCESDVSLGTSAIITNIAIDGANNLTVNAVFGPNNLGNLPVVGASVTLTGLTFATFLNNQIVTIATVTASQFTASFTHAAYTSAADTGLATIQTNVRGEFRTSKLFTAADTTGEILMLDAVNSLAWGSFGKTGCMSNAFNAFTHTDRTGITQNPDFEVSPILPPPAWTLFGAPTTVAYETSTPAPGKLKSIKITGAVQTGLISMSTFSVVPGDSYVLQAQTKSDGTAAAQVQLQFLDKNGTFISNPCSFNNAGTSWLLQTSAVGLVPANAVQAHVILNVVTATGTVWFDTVSVQRVNFPGGIVSTSLTGVGNGNTVTLLNSQGPTGAITGTGSAVTVYTFTIPGGTIAAGKGFRLIFSTNHSTGSGSVTYTLAFAGTNIVSFSGSNAGQWGPWQIEIMNAPASTTSQYGFFHTLFASTSSVPTQNGIAMNFTANMASNQAVTLTFSAANTEQLTGEGWLMELIQ